MAITPYRSMKEEVLSLPRRKQAIVLCPNSPRIRRRLQLILEVAEEAATERQIASIAGWTFDEFRFLLKLASRDDAHPNYSQFYSDYLMARGKLELTLTGKVKKVALEEETSATAERFLKTLERGSWNESSQVPQQKQTTMIQINPVWREQEEHIVVDAEVVDG